MKKIISSVLIVAVFVMASQVVKISSVTLGKNSVSIIGSTLCEKYLPVYKQTTKGLIMEVTVTTKIVDRPCKSRAPFVLRIPAKENIRQVIVNGKSYMRAW